jgi:hypothetical protein
LTRPTSPYLFTSVAEDDFPFTLTFYGANRKAVWSATVADVGALEIPKLGGVEGCRVRYATGRVEEWWRDR